MNDVSIGSSRAAVDRLHFIFHPSFEAGDAEKLYGDSAADEGNTRGFMPDEVTRDLASRMHYAAWRVSKTTNRRETTAWQKAYIEARNGIVVGNRKLIFRVVQKWVPSGLPADDLISECQLVLIKAVAAYNPWLSIRFSTYAFTCLVRALSRLAQRKAADRLSRSLESLPDGEPPQNDCADRADPRLDRLHQFLQDDAPPLTAREKLVIRRRYLLNDLGHKTKTLKQLGHDLGLSKERVRQVQRSALLKLRDVLTSTVQDS